MIERVLAIDLSTKTGWALLLSGPSGYELEAWGQIPAISEPVGTYPGNYVTWAYLCFGEIVRLIDTYHPDVLVIEETASGSKNLYSQKILEFTHFLLSRLIKSMEIPAHYFMTEEWRRLCGCVMSPEEKKRNKAVKDYKKKNSAKLARNSDNKIIGKIGRKHVNVRRANEVFGEFLKEPLRMRDEDGADALLLAYSYHSRKMKRT